MPWWLMCLRYNAGGEGGEGGNGSGSPGEGGEGKPAGGEGGKGGEGGSGKKDLVAEKIQLRTRAQTAETKLTELQTQHEELQRSLDEQNRELREFRFEKKRGEVVAAKLGALDSEGKQIRDMPSFSESLLVLKNPDTLDDDIGRLMKGFVEPKGTTKIIDPLGGGGRSPAENGGHKVDLTNAGQLMKLRNELGPEGYAQAVAEARAQQAAQPPAGVVMRFNGMPNK
jgi:hypothetical protein